jgi:cytoskeletal protein CcmA (bactofilin family)
MFRKEPEKHDMRADSTAITESPVAADRTGNPDCTPRSVSWVGPTEYFKGEIAANESRIIEGEIEGTIRHNSRNLTIGKQGRVHAEIFAKIIDVRGHVDGDIYGEELVHLFSTAVVTGTVHCTRIIMDDGAALNGTVNMTGEMAKPAKTKLALADNENLAKLAG